MVFSFKQAVGFVERNTASLPAELGFYRLWSGITWRTQRNHHVKNRAFFDPDQTLMPQVRFLDSTKPDKYGPRGF
jgi:hypothetical protein